MTVASINNTFTSPLAKVQVPSLTPLPLPTLPTPNDDDGEDHDSKSDMGDNDSKAGDPKLTNRPETTAPQTFGPLTPAPTTQPPGVGPGSQPTGGSANSQINTKNVSTNDSTEESGHTNAVTIAAVVIGCLCVIAVAVFVIRKRKMFSPRAGMKAKSLSRHEDDSNDVTLPSTRYGNNTMMEDTVVEYNHLPETATKIDIPVRPKLAHQSSSMSDDPDIVAMRIPMEKINIGALISRGGFGEVFKGSYKGQRVAIKRLLPERRKDLRQIDAFLTEAKLMGALEHERIVTFIGVAWDSLAEVCVVSEFMEGGDLRTALARFENERRMHGFDHDKIKIALHVAHAMTYLHSLQPIVLHRDLKSKNILLSQNYDAKITDFGVSRERIDATMTAGVGSSLWMAPEVMMGERYDEKADVFSFGVVLSELDTHLHPYSHATEPGTGRKIPDTAILQLVTLGRLTVEFTDSADPDLVALGKDCVAVDPTQRPTAGEVLHRVHQVWRSCVSL